MLADSSGAATAALSRLETGVDGLNCVHGGAGPDLLYLHGLRSSPRDVGALLALLTARHHTIFPTMPGFGASERIDAIRTVDDASYLYLDMVDRARLDQPILVGSSIGAWLALEMATKCPGRFAAVALVSPLGIRTGPPDVRFYPDIFSMSPGDVNRLLWADADLGEVDLRSLDDDRLREHLGDREAVARYGWDPYFHTPNLVTRLGRIGCPALIVRGEDDGLVGAHVAGTLHEALPSSEQATVPQAGHFVDIEQPSRLAEIVISFAQQATTQAMRVGA